MSGRDAIPTPSPLPPGWKIVTLCEVTTKIGSGATPRGGESAYLPLRDKFALIRSQNVFDHRFETDGLAFISDKQAAELANAQVRSEDVLLNITGDGVTFARACLVPDDILPACVNQHVSIVRANPSFVAPGYLVAYLAHPSTKGYMESFNAGGSRRAITKGHIESFQLPLPPLNEQKHIGAMLGIIDRKIELNRRMNETLEAIAGAIFKSWFVDFDPVRAKGEGRESSLLEHKADAFPGNLVDSELGPIPGGWDVGALYDRADYINGLAFGAGDFSQGRVGLPVIKIGELKDGITSQTKFTLKDLDPKYRIKAGDILFAWSGSPDTSIDIFIWTGVDGWLNQHIFKIEVQHPEERIFVYFLLRFFKPVFIEVARNKQTTGLGHVTAQDLKRLKTPVPSKDALRAFNRVAEPLFQRAYCCRQESVTLRAIRDALLPDLMSGAIRIKQAEETVEARE